MNGGIVTECPECETRFNVSEGQLKLADGKVRCGACLRVFDARAQQPYSERLDASPEVSSTEGVTPQQKYSLHVRYARHDQPDDSAPVPPRVRPTSTDQTHLDPDAPLDVSSPRIVPRQSPEPAIQHDTTPNTKPDLRPGPSPEIDAGHRTGPIPIASLLRHPPQQQPDQPETVPETLPPTDGRTPSEGPTSAPGNTGESITSSPGDSSTEDTDARAAISPAATPPTGTAVARDAAPPLSATAGIEASTEAGSSRNDSHTAAISSAQTESAATTGQVSPASPSEAPATSPGTPSHPLGLAALQDLHAEPLELAHPVAPSAPGAVLGWSLGCLAACVLLASQLAWFNRIEWSRQPALTEFYEVLCNQIECNIPPHQAIELIHNRQLVVRAHPRFEDALSIDLLLENTADFRQPFPAIELSFSDIRGRTVARRVLQPRDYLDDALDPLKMTHSQPFQVNLAILDPGRRAVSYEVQLAPARL